MTSKPRNAHEPTSIDAARTASVASIMTRHVVTVSEDDDLDVVRQQILQHHIGCAPVVDARRRPTGIISKTDLLQDAQDRPMTRTVVQGERGDDQGLRVEQDVPVRVREVMTPVAFVLPGTATIAEASSLMAYESIHHLPIIAGDGTVVGIVSSMDILRWLATTCGAAYPSAVRTSRHDVSTRRE